VNSWSRGSSEDGAAAFSDWANAAGLRRSDGREDREACFAAESCCGVQIVHSSTFR
jgi:hypothetical protein